MKTPVEKLKESLEDFKKECLRNGDLLEDITDVAEDILSNKINGWYKDDDYWR